MGCNQPNPYCWVRCQQKFHDKQNTNTKHPRPLLSRTSYFRLQSYDHFQLSYGVCFGKRHCFGPPFPFFSFPFSHLTCLSFCLCMALGRVAIFVCLGSEEEHVFPFLHSPFVSDAKTYTHTPEERYTLFFSLFLFSNSLFSIISAPRIFPSHQTHPQQTEMKKTGILVGNPPPSSMHV
ncbi:hypothetical protein F4810DRAFT_204817 [Camillea tinctor]|nr:hypothetical protein F4810DRAFT_204817 [Camillea tinctor]